MNTIAELKPYERVMIKDLAANVRQVEPYTLQLSKNAATELVYLANLAEKCGTTLVVIAKKRGLLKNVPHREMTIDEYRRNDADWKVSRVRISDPLCLMLEDAGMNAA